MRIKNPFKKEDPTKLTPEQLAKKGLTQEQINQIEYARAAQERVVLGRKKESTKIPAGVQAFDSIDSRGGTSPDSAQAFNTQVKANLEKNAPKYNTKSPEDLN